MSAANAEQSIFLAALELPTAAERLAYLQDACGTDLALLSNVRELLAAHDKGDRFLDRPPLSTTVADQAVTEQPGTVIGPYKLIKQIGEGGMGLVFVAEQTQPVRRKVALKVIKPGMDSRQVVARFEAERQALALMDHPNIAKVFDGGTTPSGRPYFVMELVKGVAITQFCDDHRLTPRERLGLFVVVCQAVQHAHQKGIIHRDLKPSNVLVASPDGTPVVKVIDFGVAKAVGQQLTEKSIYTQFNQMIGTPLYMSPEQAGQSGLDIDTRTDVYALGVLLYELLTGTTPFDPERLRKAGFDEMRRIIREEEPPKPSTRISTLGPAANPVAVNRQSDPKRLSRLCRGELDWIAMKALEKDRNRRYDNASAFAQDVQRYLADEPVQAGPPSAGYRLRKFVKRHRGPVLAATVVVLALVAGIVGTTLGLVEAWRQGDLARQATKEEAIQRRGTEWLLYASRINQAQQAWESNNAALAFHRLESCHPDFRGWEHDYLFTLFHSNQRTLRGHTNEVWSVAVSPDGERIVSGSADQTVKIWDAATGREVRTLRGHTNSVMAVVFSPDGQRIVSGSHDGTVRVWDAATGQEIRAFNAHTRGVRCVAFRPDGQRIVSSGHDGAVRVWDAQTGQETLTLKPDWGTVIMSVAFSPNGQRIVSASLMGKVWDADTGRETLTFKGHTNTCYGVAFSQDGKRIVSGSADKTVMIWDAATGREVRTLRGHTSGVAGVAVSPDGQRIVSSSVDQTVKLWNADTGEEIRALRGHTDQVTGVALMPDGQGIVSGSIDQTVKVWDAEPAEETRPSRRPRTSVTCMAFRSDGQRIVSGGDNGTTWVWDAGARQPTLGVNRHTKAVSSVAMSPDGQRIASGSHDSTVKVSDASTGKETLTFTGHTGFVYSVAFSPDGQRIASASEDQTVKVWAADTGQEIQTLKHREMVTSVVFSPDGRRIVSGSEEGAVRVWDADTGQETLTLTGHMGPVSGLAVSPDAKRIVSGSHDHTVKVWDVDTGQETLTLKGHTATVCGVALMRDGQRIVSGSYDNTVKVWDADTGYETLTLKRPTDGVRCVAVSPDGQRIVSGGHHNSMKVWDASMSQPKP